MNAAGWRYETKDWSCFLSRYRFPGLAWQLPAGIAFALTLWSLKMGLGIGVDQHRHQPVSPEPAFALALFLGVAFPLLALSLYLWRLRLRSVEDPPPGRLVVTETGLWVLDGRDRPLVVWEANEAGPKEGTVLESVRLLEEGAQAFYQAQTGMLRQGCYEGPIPVPESARAELGPALELLTGRLKESARQRAGELGSPGFQRCSLRVRQLGQVTYLTAAIEPLPIPWIGALAGLGCFGYATLLALALAGFTLFDPQDPATPHPVVVWIVRLLAVAMLLTLIGAVVRLSRMRTRQIELRVEPGRLLLDGRPFENPLDQLDLPEELARPMKDALQQAMQRES